MEKDKKNNENIMKQAKKQVEDKIKNIIETGIKPENLDNLYKLVDIHKDIANENYWEAKEENIMRYENYGRGNYNEGSQYSNYGNYGEYSEGYGARGRERDSQGRFKGRMNGRYRGEEMMDEMMYHYGNYSAGREQYGADQKTMESFKYMLKSFKDYYKHLKNEASSQQEVKMLEDTAREIAEM